MLELLLEALAMTLSDLLLGGFLVGAGVVVGLQVRRERKDVQRVIQAELEAAEEAEYVDAWASFPPKWDPPEAETDFERGEAA